MRYRSPMATLSMPVIWKKMKLDGVIIEIGTKRDNFSHYVLNIDVFITNCVLLNIPRGLGNSFL